MELDKPFNIDFIHYKYQNRSIFLVHCFCFESNRSFQNMQFQYKSALIKCTDICMTLKLLHTLHLWPSESYVKLVLIGPSGPETTEAPSCVLTTGGDWHWLWWTSMESCSHIYILSPLDTFQYINCFRQYKIKGRSGLLIKLPTLFKR